jgi:transcriptional regulator with XRE-family HTH domain
MSSERATLGTEIRRLRTAGGTTLRKFAQSVGVSAPHLSDIEHNRRRPSKKLLERIAQELQPVGATHEALERLDARFEHDLQEWASQTPEVRLILRAVKESGRPVADVLTDLKSMLQEGRR